MKLFDRIEVGLSDGILPDPATGGHRVVLWLPGDRDGRFQYWERVSNVARAGVSTDRGVGAAAATSMRARQRLGGFPGKVVQRLWGGKGSRSWVLPNGEPAELLGERQTNLMLVWSEDETTPIGETEVRSRWPGSRGIRRVGDNLLLVEVADPRPAERGADPPTLTGPPPEVAEQAPTGPPREVAEQALASARSAGDRGREVSALVDLGVLLIREGDPRRAAALLQEALAIAEGLGDRARLSDVLGNLGLAALGSAQPVKALELFERELERAGDAGDRFAEKLALDHLGHAHAVRQDHVRALASYGRALDLARGVGDRQHEAELLWGLGIEHAELGQQDRAVALGQEAVDLLRQLGNPAAGDYARLLHQYRTEREGARLGGPGVPPGAFPGGSVVTTGTGQPSGGPGLLRMAASLTSSMAKYLGSGLKPVTAEALQQRLGVCATCEHHTGLRCRVCGCFTRMKALMPHERCPVGKWPT
jgi:tetratricopeptide (TPR) repeat protein